MVPNKTLVLFTESYPYQNAGEEPFINPELRHLLVVFDRVILVPRCKISEGFEDYLSAEVDESLAQNIQSDAQRFKILFDALGSTLFYKEIINRPNILYNLAALKKLVIFVGQAEMTKRWLKAFIRSKGLDVNQCVFYTYWLNEVTAAIGMLKKELPNLRLVSRAHGYDLYEDRYTPPYIPCRKESFKALNRLYPISENGRQYLIKDFPWISAKCEVSKLGVKDPGFVAGDSNDGRFRIVSCSNIIPLKRLDLLIQGIVELAKSRPRQQIEWHHIGRGQMESKIQRLAVNLLPVNVKHVFHGHLQNQQVLELYRKHAVDVFINVSSSEGIPISAMEAQSCGIPVIATDVGGVAEIVNDLNGMLLSSDPLPSEIAKSLEKILDEPGKVREMKIMGRMNWQKYFNSEKNYEIFSRKVKNILDYV